MRRLVDAGRIGPVAGLAIGYREIAQMLREGRCDAASLEDCRRTIVHDTMAFVRRQENWLRHFPEITWVDGEDDPDGVPARVAAAFQSKLGSSQS